MTYPEFQAKWLNPGGQRVDYDHEFAYQCTDLIRQYCYEVFGLGGAAGGVNYAIDYWTSTPPGMLSKFTRVGTTTVQAGDIVMIQGSSRATSHIMIATGNQSVSEFEGMEQNGQTGNGSGIGGDAIRTRYVAKSRIAGVLRPITVQAPTPPAVPMITRDQLWQLYQSILGRDPDLSGIQHYVDHFTYDFVRNDMLNSSEYRQIQANLAAAAAAQAQAVADADAKAAQEAAKPTVPAAPAPVPTSTQKYPILVTLPTYSSKTDALNKVNASGELLAGASWYIFCEKDGVYNLTQTPGFSKGLWVNPSENVVPIPPPVVPTPPVQPAPARSVETEATIRASCIPIMPDGSPIDCTALETILAVDALGRGDPITIKKGRDLKVYSTFIAARHVFALVKIKDKATQDDYMYGVPITSRDNFEPFLDDIYKLSDHIEGGWESFFDKSVKTIEGVYSAITKKKK